MTRSGDGKPSRIRKHALRVGLSLAVGLGCLALAEGLVRVCCPHVRDHVLPPGVIAFDEVLGYGLRAGGRGRHDTRYFDVVYEINDMGHRDSRRDAAKDEETHRILLYGDSQVFGWGIPRARRFSDRIESRTERLEIWNLAVPGYGLDQEILAYERDARDLRADEVVLFVSDSTLDRVRHRYLYRKHKPAFALDENGALVLELPPRDKITRTRLLHGLLSRLYLPYFVDLELRKAKAASGNAEGGEGRAPRGGRVTIDAIDEALIERALETARERGHRLTLLVHLAESPGEQLRTFCTARDIGFLDPVPYEELRHLRLGLYDSHWNETAHERIASRLRPELERRTD